MEWPLQPFQLSNWFEWFSAVTTRGTHMKEVIVVIEVETLMISATEKNLQANFADARSSSREL